MGVTQVLSNLDSEALRSLPFALAILLASARLMGHLARRRGIPPVVGELAAGVLLGPSVLGAIAPGLGQAIVPDTGTTRIVLEGLALLGVMLLLASTGAALDVRQAARRLRPGVWLPILGLIIPLGAGIAMGALLPQRFLGEVDRPLAAVFLGVMLAISALPTIARSLRDLDLLHREVGQLVIASAAIDDLAGWILLAVLTTGLGTAGSTHILAAVVGVLAFLLVAWVVGRRVVDTVLGLSLRMTETVAGPVTAAVVVILVTSWIATMVDLDPIIGALVAGMLLGDSPALRPQVQTALDDLTTAVLGPVFFALAGAALDLRVLRNPRDLAWTAALLAVAVASKLVGAQLGASIAGIPRRVGLAVGIGLSARGGLGIVVAAVAVGAGALSATGYAAVVVVAVVTSIGAPFFLGRLVASMPEDLADREQGTRRAQLDASSVVGARRVLLLTRGGAHSRVAARVLDLALDPAATVTVLVVDQPDDGSSGQVPGDDPTVQSPRATGEAVASLMGHRKTQVRVVPAKDVADTILDEARRGYDLLVVGASGAVQAPAQFGAVLNRVLLGCPVPVMLVRSRTDSEGLIFHRLLTGASGTDGAQAAQDVAFGLARGAGAAVDVVHVIARSDRIMHASWFQNADRQPAPHHLLGQAAARAGLFGITAETHARVGSATAEELLGAAADAHADTLVLATTTRALVDRPFLGHGIEFLLENAPQNLVIVTYPTAPA